MKHLVIVFIILISSAVYSQQKQAVAAFDEIGFLDALGKKEAATVGDALKLFDLVIEKKQPAAKDDPANDVPLKKGFIALKVADSLSLTDSIIYTIFKSERYAFRVCVAHNLLNIDGSEYDKMSGEELIEFLQLASEYRDKGAAQ